MLLSTSYHKEGFPRPRTISPKRRVIILITSIFILVSLRMLAAEPESIYIPSIYTTGSQTIGSTVSTGFTDEKEDTKGQKSSQSHSEYTDYRQDVHQSATLETTSSSNHYGIPEDYVIVDKKPGECAKRLGLAYLEELRHNRATYCSDQSRSQLTCFHSQTDKSGRVDSFCIAQGSKLNDARAEFQVSCGSIEPRGTETLQPSVPLRDFPKYWYETGPRMLMDKFVNISDQHLNPPLRKGPEQFMVLVKREGAGNPWHCLMEIMSLAMTFDVLQISPDSSKDQKPFITSADADNTQVVILDDEVDGPYFDLWRLFSKRPTIRMSELPAGAYIENLILPLPGASNPLWQGDWEVNKCQHSDLLRTFSKRVMKHLNISETRDASEEDKIIITFIDRRGTRKLVDIEKHIAALRERDIDVEVRLVDFATMPFIEQIRIVQDSDVLAGVHGAGLTHGMWLKGNSVIVEIMPENFEHKGFRNMAGALGHGYFRAHGTRPRLDGGSEQQEKQDWQREDVAIEEDRFLGLMDVAVKSIYSRGAHDFDVIK